ncbi:M23 family metallopeptidase [Streptomyces bathyalis]|nr:M23 family metallopeptidase [Streptomyces bathyalis]
MALLLLNDVLLLCVLAALHWYLWKRLVKDVSRQGGPWRRAGTVLVFLFVAISVGILTAGPDVALFQTLRVFAWADLWAALLGYLTLALLLGEVVRPLLRRWFARRAARTPEGPGEETGPARQDPAGEVLAGAGHGSGSEANRQSGKGGGADGPTSPGPEGEGSGNDAPGDNGTGEAGPPRRLFVARTVAVGATALAGVLTYDEAMASELPSQSPGDGGIEVSLPFTGRWRVENSPARRVPSHGTDMFGGRYAIDFVGVDERHRTAGSRSWRTFLATEPPELYFAFGQPVLAPRSGTVVAVHDGEIDHEGRRSQLALVPYALGQAGRVRQGVGAVAGNHVIISMPESRTFLALAHFQAGSIRVSVGEKVAEGQHIGNCGNSGNSTQPHVHMQAMDSSDLSVARGVPMLFRRFREWPSSPDHFRVRERAMPGERAVVEPLPVPSKAPGH